MNKKSDCRWCEAGNVPELSPHTNTYIHRRDTLDKPCTNPRCPKCGEVATFKDANGTFWDSSAHSWRDKSPEKETGFEIRCCESGNFGDSHECHKNAPEK